MKRFVIALGAALIVSVSGALAQNAPPPNCVVIGNNPLTQNESDITISCSNMPEALAGPLTAVLTRILQQRLDPQQLMAKLNEVAALPYGRPKSEDVVKFQQILRDGGVNVHVRKSRGRDIDAACGQLRRREQQESKPSLLPIL